VALKKVVESIFPRRYYDSYFRPDSTRIIARWEKRDTTVREKFDISNWSRRGDVFMLYASAGTSAGSVAPYGMGGSMARFAITGDRLYTAGQQNLDVFNIVNPQNPLNSARKSLGWNIETIYPFRNKLFIGSQTGMLVYSINDPDNPVQEGEFGHTRVCDPVIADNRYAYVTLRSGTTCQGFTNELDILDLSTFSSPTLYKTYAMTNPHGLSKDGNTLFICDGEDGLKVYNAGDPLHLQLIKQMAGIETYDVIAFNGNALVVAKDGLYQYDYSDLNNIRLRSRIPISN
jgi:hypothetical protein